MRGGKRGHALVAEAAKVQAAAERVALALGNVLLLASTYSLARHVMPASCTRVREE
jgi:hypothetical protein